jgi:tetratricopeptide (TPR) repeat protein
MNFSYDDVVTRLDKTVDAVVNHKRQAVLAIGGVIFLILAVLGYQYYSNRSQMLAHKDFVEAVKYLDAPIVPSEKAIVNENAMEFPTPEAKWKKIEEVFRTGYQNHRHSGIAPMFRAYQAEALLHLNKPEEALTELDAAVKSMPSDALKDFYRLKLALLKIDMNRPELQKEGFADLKKIAETSTNAANEAGLYYIGLYFWSQKDFAQTKNYWQQLMVKYGLKEGKDQSAFAELAKAKLRLISAEW